MSLLESGPHTVLVYLEEEVDDWRDNPVRQPAAGSPVTVSGCWMQPISSSRGSFAAREVDEGQRVTVQYRLIARNAPVGWWSAVEWQGRRFTILGGPQYRDFSDLTTHMSVTLQEER